MASEAVLYGAAERPNSVTTDGTGLALRAREGMLWRATSFLAKCRAPPRRLSFVGSAEEAKSARVFSRVAAKPKRPWQWGTNEGQRHRCSCGARTREDAGIGLVTN